MRIVQGWYPAITGPMGRNFTEAVRDKIGSFQQGVHSPWCGDPQLGEILSLQGPFGNLETVVTAQG